MLTSLREEDGMGRLTTFEGLWALVWPEACAACGELLSAGATFCEECFIRVEELPPLSCRRCGLPGPAACGRCDSLAFDAAAMPFEHGGALAEAVQRFKYQGQAWLARTLAREVAWRCAARLAAMPGPLCPVPLHPRRYRERGYCQATLLAVHLARRLGRPLEDGWLSRTRATEAQVGLGHEARLANVHGAFQAAPQVAGRDVVLVDDVVTTGATAHAAALALKERGARRVSLLAVGRAV